MSYILRKYESTFVRDDNLNNGEHEIATFQRQGCVGVQFYSIILLEGQGFGLRELWK